MRVIYKRWDDDRQPHEMDAEHALTPEPSDPHEIAAQVGRLTALLLEKGIIDHDEAGYVGSVKIEKVPESD